MSIFSDVIDAVTPAASSEDRQEARAQARGLSTPGDWLATIIDHHEQLEAAFAAVKAAAPEGRLEAQKNLAVLLVGHAIAEESVIYPAMADSGEKGHAKHGYTEQATVKMEMAELEKLDPAGQDYIDKLETIQTAVAHHMYEEESTWFPALKNSSEDDAMLTRRYREEFERYVGKGAFSF